MKIASWNVNSIRVRLEQVLEWLDAEKPDVLGLQELKMQTSDFLVEAFAEVGYHSLVFGQKTYNGVAFLSREEGSDLVTGFPNYADVQSRAIAATFGDTRVINLYVPNGQTVESDKYVYKLEWLDALLEYLEAELKQHSRLAVFGDFNIAPADEDVHDPKSWAGKVLCSAPERDRLERIAELGMQDTYRLFEQKDETYSWWDYRMAGFRRNRGLRIDLIFASADLVPACTAAGIDITPRALERPSDHAPVWLEFD